MKDGTRDRRLDGLIVIDKPAGLTSRQVVDAVQRRLPRGARVGHTGTLDPLATGVLVLCVGQATRLAEPIQDLPKTYRASVRLGATSTTDDADGEISERLEAVPITEAVIMATLPRFLGEIEQVPPAYSAVKQQGQRAYERARSGQALTLAPRRVRIEAIRLIRYQWPLLHLEIDCGKGTYIRALARDLGQVLGVGGLITALRRTRVGPFDESSALAWTDLQSSSELMLRPPAEAVAHWPRCDLTATECLRLRHGQAIRRTFPMGECALFYAEELVAIGRSDGGRILPIKVFAHWQ